MSWRLLSLLPVGAASGTDVTRSACGRLSGEITLLPTAYPQASWRPGEQAGTAIASLPFGAQDESAEPSAGTGGRLLKVRENRWGNPDGAPLGRYPFGMSAEAEAEFGGITIPQVLRAGWWWRTERQAAGKFFRAQITSAVSASTPA